MKKSFLVLSLVFLFLAFQILNCIDGNHSFAGDEDVIDIHEVPKDTANQNIIKFEKA